MPDSAPERAARPRAQDRVLAGWGAVVPSRASVVRPDSTQELMDALRDAPGRGALARGLGRSYGDAAQNAGGRVLDVTGLDAIVALDRPGRRVTVQAGVSFETLIRALMPLGLFVPVTPGTSQVTVGGAIACDVHGKNHHADGGVGAHVERLSLATPDGAVLELAPGSEAFAATLGGMGLTGVVLDATLRLIPVETSWLSVDTERASDLDDLMARLTAGDDRYRYSVAWVDCLATGRRLGRGVLIRGDHATRDELAPRRRARPLDVATPTRLSAPDGFPSGVLTPSAVRAFNELWFRRAPRERRGELERIGAFFHPLDGIQNWNRLYGRRGFLQYQLVVPFGAERVLRQALELLAKARMPSFLAVVKRLGRASGLLSFPIPGWTLSLDLPAGVERLDVLLDRIDELVAEAGGRVYFAKDARLRPELLEAMYPQLPRWRQIRARLDPAGTMRSDLDRRLALTG